MAIKKTIRVENVTKQYRAGKVVFSDITTSFSPGDTALLTGPNGSGKTTFLKLLSVNTFPTRGTIHLGDMDIHEHPYQYLKHVGLVHDEEALPQHMSAAELLEWILRSRQLWDEGASSDKIRDIFDHLELGDAQYDEIGTYSTGMRKKAQIAAAFITEPTILILDEPLRGLDQSSTARTMELIRKAVQRDAILLMASHSRTEGEGIFKKEIKFPLKN